jgi:hypothetical protein
VLKRAREVLSKLEEIEFDIFADKTSQAITKDTSDRIEQTGTISDEVLSKVKRSKLAAQITLFQAANDALLQQLRETKIEHLTTEEMRQLLVHLQTRSI